MPYIPKSRRERFEKDLRTLIFGNPLILNGGDLNYFFTKICLEYMKHKGESYENYSTCISSLECAKLELYRRQVAKYEDIKITENGDIE